MLLQRVYLCRPIRPNAVQSIVHCENQIQYASQRLGSRAINSTSTLAYGDVPPDSVQLDHPRIIGSGKIRSTRGIKISSLLQKHLGLSRRQSERMIVTERITLYGKCVTRPTFEVGHPDTGKDVAIKVDGRLVQGVEKTLQMLLKEQENLANETCSSDSGAQIKQSKSKDLSRNKTRIWLCNKLKGELITEDDPDGRPSMLQRLMRGGVGIDKKNNNLAMHLKPVGRLDMMTEGLMIVTNDGHYARSLELPINQLWRTYRVRVHGRLTLGKLNAMRKGVTVKLDEDMKDKTASGEVVQTQGRTMKYKGIKVSIERKSLANGKKRRGLGQSYSGGTNTWLQITCTEGKNRMLRRILSSMGLDVTRLIRVSYGDYDLNTIPPGRAVEVPCKALDKMKKRGPIFASERNESGNSKTPDSRKGERDRRMADVDKSVANAVQWISYS